MNDVDGSFTSGCEDKKGGGWGICEIEMGNLEFAIGLNTTEVVVMMYGCLILVSHFKMVIYCKVSDKFIDIVKHRERATPD